MSDAQFHAMTPTERAEYVLARMYERLPAVKEAVARYDAAAKAGVPDVLFAHCPSA